MSRAAVVLLLAINVLSACSPRFVQREGCATGNLDRFDLEPGTYVRVVLVDGDVIEGSVGRAPRGSHRIGSRVIDDQNVLRLYEAEKREAAHGAYIAAAALAVAWMLGGAPHGLFQ